MFDMVIKNGRVVDGSGEAGYTADIAVAGGKLQLLRPGAPAEGRNVIDARGLVVAPGFIDDHSHSDLLVLCDPSGHNMLEQGITTEITGMCGLGMAPASPWLSKYIGAEALYRGDRAELLSSLTEHKAFFEMVERMGTGTNLAFYIAQGSVRLATMGFENRRPSPDELAKMRAIVREGMEQGAIGLSTGLIYPPGAFTEEGEIVELCKVVAEYGGTYCSHIRNESHHVVESVGEAIRIGEGAGVPVIISHHKIIGKRFWGGSRTTLSLIDAAVSRGVGVAADLYPYTAGATFLKSALPPQFASQGTEVLITRLKEAAFRNEVRSVIQNDQDSFENLILSCGFENIQIVAVKDPHDEGKTVARYAAERDMDPLDAVFDVIVESGGRAFGIFTMMSDEDVERIMAHPAVMFGTDGMVIVPGLPGLPRAFGTFPRILGRYVREKKILGLEEAIRKMTSLPAAMAGLRNKGLVREGYDADLVVFDPDTVIDHSTIAQPTARNEGLAYVIVNGEIAVKDNVATGARAGRVLRRS